MSGSFEDLKREWSKRLADSGFKDMDDFPKRGLCTLRENYEIDERRIRPEAQEEYFHNFIEIVNNERTKYKHEVHEFILKLFITGIGIGKIVEALDERGTPRYRGTVRNIIRKYGMEWNILRKR